MRDRSAHDEERRLWFFLKMKIHSDYALVKAETRVVVESFKICCYFKKHFSNRRPQACHWNQQ